MRCGDRWYLYSEMAIWRNSFPDSQKIMILGDKTKDIAMKCKEAVKKVKEYGWTLNRVKGSHYHFKHPSLKGLITIPYHGSKELSPRVLSSIARSLGINI